LLIINISIEQYKLYCDSFKDKDWDLKEESIKYHEQEVKTLYQVIDAFSKDIFKFFLKYRYIQEIKNIKRYLKLGYTIIKIYFFFF